MVIDGVGLNITYKSQIVMEGKARSSSITGKRTASKQEGIFSQSFQIIPAEVVFKDIEVNQYYEITVEIRNLTNRAKRIRFQKPENPNFKVIYSMQPEIAPGLSTTAKIKYECKELKNETEIIKVISEEGLTVQLPVRVYKMESQILFEPFVDMGFLKIGKEHEEKIAIKNNGKAAGSIQFSHEHGPLLTVDPKILKISPQEESFISVKYKPTEAGIFKGLIRLKSESILVKDSIDIHATSVEHSRYIIDDKNNQTFSFDFGTMFVGEESLIKAFVVNNSPKRMMFRTVFRKGYLISPEEFVNVQTPSEIGSEQSERVMFMEPEAASIEPFQELEVKFYCRTKVSYRDRVFTKSYALTPTEQQGAINHKKNSNEFKPENIYEYSILLASEGDDPIIMQLKANAICPQIKLENDLFQFGDCPVKEKRELTFALENRNGASKVDISFQKIPNFAIVPASCSLKPNEATTFKLVFQPNTIGKIDSIQKLVINKIYEIDLRCFGIATSQEPRSRSRKRIESIRQSPQLSNTLKQSDFKTRNKALSAAEKTFVSQIRKSTQQAELIKLELQSHKGNKGLYNKFLVERRQDRLDKQREDVLHKKWSLYQSKLQDLGVGGKYDEKLDEEGIPSNSPIDYEFETGVNDTRIKRQNIPIPTSKERLYVTKHIADYEPLPVSHTSTDKFTRNIMQGPKKIHIEAPVNFNHKREVASQLTPEQLSSIQVAVNSINFGEVYIKSHESRFFWIKNGTKKAISVCLKITEAELANSYKKSQVIQSGSDAGFELTFCKDTLGDFKTSIKYVINGHHEFELSVLAKSVPVEIDIDRTNLKFEFDPASLEMSTSESVTLYNSGNSNAFFKFILNKERLFSPKQLEGTIKSKQKLSIPITLTVPIPAAKKNEYNFTERIIMKVLDGNEITLTCTFSAVDPKYTTKCDIFNSAPTLCIGHQLEEIFEIKNTSKAPIVFHIEGTGVIINEKLKLSPEQVKKLKVRFVGKEVGKFNCAINITPRCGQRKTIETVINVVDPNIVFSNDLLQMGVLVVQGIAGQSNFSLTNKSPIELPLIIDIRSKKLKIQNPDFIEYLKLALLDEQQQLEVVGMTQRTEEKAYDLPNEGENLVGLEINEEEFDNSDSDQEQIPQKNEDEERRYRLILKPDKEYKFTAQFSPKEAGSYSIEIPMFIERSVRIMNTPAVSCESINPQFIFEPSVIDFKRKIVTKPDRCYPKFIPVKISNIDEEDVEWEVKDEELKKEGIFNIEVSRGVLKAKQTLEFKVSFNPYSVGTYNHRLPLFIKSSKLKEPLKYVDIVLMGTSSLPMLFFNKREVMMPVVPLDIETTSSFRVLNDGYENCNLKCQFLDDVANIGVQISYPEGLNIGITKQKIKIDLTWKFSKPISFTLKLEFTDDMNRTFTIPVSGTADNCIFSNYTYILRNQHKLTIKMDNALQLVEIPEPQTTGLQRKNSAHSLKSSQTNKSLLSYLGVAPISPAILSNTIDYITRYLNSNLLTIPITNFPGSLIETDGAPLFEILSFVSSKSTNFPWRLNGSEKGLPKVQKAYDQYNELVKMLKVEGAQLNHIRPEYLLSYADLNLYLANLPAEKTKCFLPSLLKITSGLFNYLSMESWITLLYQMFKIYVLARVTPKNYKMHLPTSPEIPAHTLLQSNFTSASENILFFWAEQAVNEVLLEQRRLTNFDKDFKDGTVIGALLQKYANVLVLKKMKMICSSDDDYKQNATVLCEQLAEVGLQNHITPKDFLHPLQREMLLFLLHLYVYLPFYTPKSDPIVFKCVLGEEVTRSIELNNPSNKPVNYLVKYEGCEDFKLINDAPFRIEAKQTYKFEVRFVSRVSAPVKGRIMFINVKEKSLTAAALVFELKSEITGKVSDRIWNVSGLLYEQIEFPIEVANKFSSAELVDFAITYQTEYIFDAKLLKGKNAGAPLPKDQQIQTVYGKADNIKIRKNATATLTLNYVPMSMFTTRTTIFFVNNIVGEFQHEIIASVEPPSVTAEIRPTMALSVDQIANWDYPINPKNDMIVRAKKAIESLKKTKKGSVATLPQQNRTTDAYTSETFMIDIGANPYVSAKDSITITDRPANDKAKETTSEGKKKDSITQIIGTQNKIQFSIICKNPVYEFSTYILLSNKTKTDVRRYRIVFTIQPKPLKAILEMNVPARSEVTQNLPIVNNTERDWNIKITWQPDPAKNGNYFIINSAFSSSFPVKRNSIGNFPITFKPKWANQAEAKLIMSNPLTLDNFEYQITGNGEEPLAEEHIEIKCEAKQLVKKELVVKNPYQQKPISLRVQTDLLNCESVKKLTIPSGGKEKFEFTVQPMLCGEYTGSITFYQEEGPQYIWYTISIVTNYPVALKTMHIESEIRKKHLQKIEVPYDGDRENAYQVIINGVGLSGYSSISLKPGALNIYQLEYLPLEVGEEKGSICFINPEIGEILYQFDLRCTPRPVTTLNNIKSPLGVSTFIEAELQNPTNSKAVIKVVNSNPEQFALKSNLIKLGPFQVRRVEIEYIPASLDNIQSANIKFSSKQIGDWQYELSGMGLSPVPFPPYVVYNGLLEEHSDSVKFRNPFKYDITVGVKLVCPTTADERVFRLLNTSKSKFQIESFSMLEVPFSFIPTGCRMYECKILVMISEKIFWTFPIRGITEINEGKTIVNLTAQCRTTTTEYVQIPLDGIENYKQNNSYDFKLENVPQHYANLIDKFLIIDCTKKSLNHAKDTLEFQFLFKPMKPGKAMFDFLVMKEEGSRWRFRVQVEGTEPEPDDVIDIESGLLITSTINFKMTNSDKSSAQFKAKFTSDSAHEFSVQPKQGVLAKFGSKGTNFFISFTPVQYGKEKKGKLIIETSEMYWSYLLKGSLPKYVPPKLQAGSRTRIASEKK